MYRHHYSVTSCPECDEDLTTKDAVTIEASGHDGQSLGEFPTRLDGEGELRPDAAGMLAGGFHSGTKCTECGASLDDYEDTDQEDNDRKRGLYGPDPGELC